MSPPAAALHRSLPSLARWCFPLPPDQLLGLHPKKPRLFPAAAALHYGLPPLPPRWFPPSAGAQPGTAPDGAGVVCPFAGPVVPHAALVASLLPAREMEATADVPN
uniref:Uncharacterized protein n=1 Tax=Oryza meridionalis TaxID=40149 RepID=A0A0E0D5Y0_9ORYZ